MTTPYETLQQLGLNSRLLTGIGYFLEWDQETFMPKGAIDTRGQQLELISSLIHKEKTSEEFKNALSALIDLETGTIKTKHLDDLQKANLREWRNDYLNDSRLPNDFVKTFAKTTSKAISKWAEAKKDDSFEIFEPHLDQIIDLLMQKSELIGYDNHPYDAHLSVYEPGITTETLKSLFGELKPFLKDLLSTLSQKKVDDHFLRGNFSEKDQMSFCQTVLNLMGVDANYSRLDKSNHPFCLGVHPHDVRLTTFTPSSGFFQSISAALHEGGHALYELGLPVEHYGTPIGEYTSTGMHESQSRYWETFIGLSLPFWEHIYPKLQETFPDPLKKIDCNTFYQGINKVEPSFIRVFADEVSYILHIILRFEIELEFIEGKLSAKDLPTIWNKKMEESFGITPKTNREGCLQDIHWSAGLFGYFPTYALGNLYAGHFHEAFTKAYPDYQERIRQGHLSFIREFLRENIHRYGRQYSALELTERISGHSLSPDPYMNYLKEKHEQH